MRRIGECFHEVLRHFRTAAAGAVSTNREVSLSDGDVERLVVATDGDETWLAIYSGGEDEPLVQALLNPQERGRLAAVLREQPKPRE